MPPFIENEVDTPLYHSSSDFVHVAKGEVDQRFRLETSTDFIHEPKYSGSMLQGRLQTIQEDEETKDVEAGSTMMKVPNSHEHLSSVMYISELNNRQIQGGSCKILVKSEPIQNKYKGIIISCIQMSSTMSSSKLILTLYNSDGKVKRRLDLFGKLHSTGRRGFRLLKENEKIVSEAEAGDFYQLETKVDAEEDYVTVKRLVCKAISWSNMCSITCGKDPYSGKKGFYIASQDENGKPHGRGSFHFSDNGCTFCGWFHRGKWVEGVLYFIHSAKLSVTNRKWDRKINEELLRTYKQNAKFYTRSKRSRSNLLRIENITSGRSNNVSLSSVHANTQSSDLPFCGCFGHGIDTKHFDVVEHIISIFNKYMT